MKISKITYYITTAIISIMMLFIAYETLTKPEVKVSMARLGFPDYFRIELGITKIIGGILIWFPIMLLKEMAYFGLAFTFLSAFIVHYASGYPTKELIAPIAFLIILIVSYITNQKLENKNLI